MLLALLGSAGTSRAADLGAGAVLAGRADKLYAKERYAAAILLYKQALAKEPGSIAALKGLKDSHEALGNMEEALSFTKKYDLAVKAKAAALEREMNGDEAPAPTPVPAAAKQTEAPTPAPVSTPAPTEEARPVAKAPEVKKAPAPAPAQDGSWVGPTLRSAVLPGWGQVNKGHTTKGLVIGATTLGLLAGSIVTAMAAEDAENRYKAVGPGQSQDQYDSSYKDWESSANLNHILVIGFGLLYTYNLIDAITGDRPEAVAAEPSRINVALIRGGISAGCEILKF